MAAEQLKIIKKILAESTDILCVNLEPSDMLRTLQTNGALKPDDVIKIRNLTTTTEQVGKLLDMLTRKPASAFDRFMEALKEEREDLFDMIKDIAAKHRYIHKAGKYLEESLHQNVIIPKGRYSDTKNNDSSELKSLE